MRGVTAKGQEGRKIEFVGGDCWPPGRVTACAAAATDASSSGVLTLLSLHARVEGRECWRTGSQRKSSHTSGMGIVSNILCDMLCHHVWYERTSSGCK